MRTGPKPTPAKLAAAHLLSNLMSGGMTSDDARIGEFLELAERYGLRGSDVLVGVIQPALQEIGSLWESDRITVADEHRFTKLCLKLYARLPPPPRATGPASIVLALAPDNRHDVGVRILERLAAEHGVRCRVMPTGSPSAAIVAMVTKTRPSALGLSMARSSSTESVKDIMARCERAVPGIRMLVGGRAAREIPSGMLARARCAKRVDDFLAELEDLAAKGD